MILVDSSVWVDYFRKTSSRQTEYLYNILGTQQVGLGDLTLTEVLQGYRSNSEYHEAKRILLSLPIVNLGGEKIAIQAADHYRHLRKKGLTIRGTIDVLIATFCVENKCKLLYADRDFDVMVKHLGLISALGKAN